MGSPTTEIGNLGEALAVGKLTSLGYRVLLPFVDGCRYDVAVERDGKYQRVQVKTVSQVTDNGVVVVRLYSVARGGKAQRYAVTDVDVVLVYVVDIDRWFWLDAEECGVGDRQQMYLRIEPPKDYMRHNIHDARQYEV